MKGIKIYVEGGNIESKAARASLREGLDALLASQKAAARSRRLHWDVVFCGSRNEAHEAFVDALKGGYGVTALLVDSEEEIARETGNDIADAQIRLEHLRRRDRWTDLGTNLATRVHLMVQTMETWISADVDMLARFYQQGFNPKRLSARPNLEEESKKDIETKLKNATKDSKKKEYHKIRHAGKLLATIRPELVARRCPRFATFTRWLDELIPSL